MSTNRNHGIALAAVVSLATLAWTTNARGQCELDKFLGSGGERAGHSVDISGDWAVLGAIYQDQPGGLDDTGGVLVFHRNDAGTPEDLQDDFWEFDSNLLHNDPEAGDQLGFSVSINGDYIAAGAPVKGASGAAYVFVFNGSSWTQRAKILPPAGTANGAWFGYSVAVAKGPTTERPFVVVGAPLNNPNSVSTGGSAFVFSQHETVPSVWPLEAPLVPSDVTQGQHTGWSVAASFANPVDRVVVGAPQASNSFGAAYVFYRPRNGVWSQEQRITGCAATSGFNFGPGQFGYAVSIANSESLGADQIVVGAPYCNRGLFGGTTISDTGSAYAFAFDGSVWNSVHTLRKSSSVVAGDNYGRSVATSGDTILAGIYGDDGAASSAGAAVLYFREGSSWADVPTEFRLQASDAASGARMGQSVALDGVHGLVGAHLDSGQNGAAYLFGVGPDSDDDSWTDLCDICPFDFDPDQLDGDGDGTGDACDNCPGHFNEDQLDSDDDDVGDVCDNCPFVANGPTVSTCIAGAVTPCATDEECDSSVGSHDGRCSIPLGICLEGLSVQCAADGDCDTSAGAADGSCTASQSDVDGDGVGDLCDNCPDDWNPNQADFNNNGLGDACDAIWNIVDELVPPDSPAYDAAVPAAYAMAVLQTSPDGATYYPEVFCASGTPESCTEWEGRWFANEPGVVTIQWQDTAGQPVDDPVTYVITDSVGTPPPQATYDIASVRYLRDWATVSGGAPVTIDTNLTLTVLYNSTFLENEPPVTPSDVYVTANTVQTPTTKTGKIVFQYTDGPSGRLMGFEVVDIQDFGTPSASPVEVGRQLAIPAGADCKAHFVTNATQGEFAAAWQRNEAPLDVWPIRPEVSASNFVVAWYNEVPFTGHCWHQSIQRFTSDWPADPQPFVVVNDGVADPSIVELPVGESNEYCLATVMYPGPFTAPRAAIEAGNLFSASEPGYAVVRFDVKEDQPGATCSGNRVDVKFEVIRAYDHLASYNEGTGEGVNEGEYAAPIGTQIDHPLHDTHTPLYPFGYLYSGRPFAEDVYNDTGQIFPVNSSDVHGLLEVWWFKQSGYAPHTYWPFRVGQYNAQWPTARDLGDPIIIASRSGAGRYPPGSLIYELGVPGGSQLDNGWNPNDEHAILLPVGGTLRAFAVRDDNPWNVTSGHPYTLVQYPEQECSGGTNNPCVDEGDCDAGQSCDPTGLWRMGVHSVIAEQSPFFFDYSDFPNQADPAETLPVVAGLPIDPLFPVNLGAAPCLSGTPPQPLTNVVGDGLWVDRGGGIWAVEQETDDAVPQTSIGTIYLWENWAADGGCQPWRDFSSGTPTPIVYRPSWPPVPPDCTYPTDPACARPLAPGEQVDETGQCGSINVLHDSVGIRIIDPTHEVYAVLPALPAGVDFAALPPHLVGGELSGGGDPVPDRIRHVFNDGLYFRGIMSDRDRDFLDALSTDIDYRVAIALLQILSHDQLTTPVADPAEKWVSVADADVQEGWVTVAFQNDDACHPLPVSAEVWHVACPPATGRIQAIEPTCPFNEKIVLQHTVDGGGRPELLTYQWQWSADYDPSTQQGTWNDYNPPSNYADGQGLREVVIEGASPFTLADSWWRVRYRGYVNCPCNGADCNQGDDPWPAHLADDGTSISDWSDPQLAEGWVKRVVRGINPFDQRVADFHASPINTFVDMIGQAGVRFESPVALNCSPDNIEDLGLIEVYETVLRRARAFSIDVGVSYDPATLAILLVSSKISDLYMLLGNEAFADGSDPTIGLFAGAGDPPAGYDPHAVFCFEDQVPTVLDEELAMLRGQDTIRPPDLDPDGRVVGTVYNRLPWNFTGGNGQVAYANNYQVTDVLEARNIYSQGHGDAYGHYLTALKKFYALLRHPAFEWVVSTESVSVAGQPVQVGFQYERAFARAAAAKARTGAAITSLTFRQRFDADPSQQNGYPDLQDPDRAWGVSEWARRAGQGAYFDWVTANALLDDEDDDPAHENTIQKIDRSTVVEIREVAAAFQEIQSTMEKANNGLNPLGLAANVVPFGLNPGEIEAGKTHFDQIYERANGALVNAVTAFDYANENTRRLRAQQDAVEQFGDLVDERERDLNGRLIEIFGKPYPQDVGATGAYPVGYDGPDVLHFDYVEPSALLGQQSSSTVTMLVNLSDVDIDPNTGQYGIGPARPIEFSVSADGFGMVKPEGWGSRPEVGEIQLARSEIVQALGRFRQAQEAYEAQIDSIVAQLQLLKSRKGVDTSILNLMAKNLGTQMSLNDAILEARRDQLDARREAESIQRLTNAAVEALPKLTGIFTIDTFSPVRGALIVGGILAAEIGAQKAINAEVDELRNRQDLAVLAAEQQLTITGWEQDFAIEKEITAITELVRALPGMRLELHTLSESVNQAAGRYQSAIGRGLRLLEERLAFRQKSARDVAEYRYRDMAFRIFRNDALQKYRAQFDLAARYAYLAARAYDYETNLLGSDTQAGRAFLTDIVKERVLGAVNNGSPQVGNGLAGRLAELSANWTALKPQLGFNSLNEINRTFSLRWEMFRKPNSAAYDEEWSDILSSFIVPDLNALQEYRQYCQPLQPAVPNNPAIVIPLATTVQSGLNLFGWPSTGDATLPSDRFAIKLHSHAVRFTDYPGFPLNQQANVYLVPVGADIMRTPTCPEAPTRQWQLLDQTLPAPFPIGTQDLNTVGWLPWDALDGGSAAMVRRRLIPTVAACGADDPLCTDISFKLTGRSVWNTHWLLIIPGSELLGADPQQGIDVFVNGVSPSEPGVRDIKLLFNSYGYSGCVSGSQAVVSGNEGEGIPTLRFEAVK